jgi:hypothetical protein
MMTRNQTEREEIEALLPWHAAGTLSRRDAQRVEAAIEEDRDLARQFELVREELSETIHLNETLGAPSARAMERLLAGIEAEGVRPRKQRFDLATFIAARLSIFSPRTLAWSAAAAVLAIVLQAGLLAGLYVGGERGGGSGGYQTASYTPAHIPLAPGSYALIGFAAQASAADVTKFLETHKVSVVDGPRPGGIYTVRVSVTALPKSELSRIVKQMQDDSKVVRFAAPTE